MRLITISFTVLILAGCSEKAPPPPAPDTAAAPAKAPAAKAAKKVQYKEVAVSGGGKIVGKVTWDGPRPKVDPFPINKNKDVCDTGKTGKRKSTRLMINKAGGVKNAVVFLEGITEGKAMPKGPFVLNQQGCEYYPHILVVPRRAEVTLKSSDNLLHNVHMFGAANYNIPFPKPAELKKKLRKTGVVRLQCDAGHGWMTAYFHVGDHPYYAVTGADGSYEIADVPPGKYKIRMWHEHWQVAGTTEKDGVVATYTFAEPLTQDSEVEVAGGGAATANFKMKGS